MVRKLTKGILCKKNPNKTIKRKRYRAWLKTTSCRRPWKSKIRAQKNKLPNPCVLYHDCVISFFVLLFVGPVWEGGQKDEDNSLHSALYNSLSECHSRQLSSLAVPAISSGIFGFPKARCAKVLFSSVLEFFRAEPKSSVNLVRFTNFDKPTVEVFKDAAADLNEEPDVRVELGQASS